jgi:protein HIRA/HIR1
MYLDKPPWLVQDGKALVCRMGWVAGAARAAGGALRRRRAARRRAPGHGSGNGSPPAPGPRSPSGQTFSVDVDAEGARLVTAGSSAVRVWNMAPVLDEAAELDASVPRLLATMQDHSAPVNVARFSRDGKRIASGSDDMLIIVYERRPGGLGGAESWRPAQTALRGHGSNVTDVAWSHDGGLLASAGVDGAVNVWSVAARPYALAKALHGHAGHVKGVAWDPLGRYLASQGDDGVRLWAVDGLSPVLHISQDFKFASKSVFHLRWVP